MKYSEIDKQRWDDCISRSHNGLIYANSWYLDIISPAWDAVVKGEYEAVMPVTAKSKFGIYLWQQPFYAQQLGIFSDKNISQEEVNEFFATVPSELKYINIQLNSAHAAPEGEYDVNEVQNLYLDLNKPYHDLQKKYSSSHKRAIKNAKKATARITEDISPRVVMEMIKAELGEKVQELKGEHYEMQVQLMDEALRQDYGLVRGVLLKGKLSSVVFLYKYKNRLTYIFAIGNEQAKEFGLNIWLIDQLIQEFCNKNWIFDFEGSSIPSVAEFYRRFGAESEIYYRIKRNRLPFLLKWLK